MNLNALYKRWKAFVARMNEFGVPVPTARDPKTGKGSVSFSLVVISTALVVMGIVGKWSKLAGDIDLDNAMEFLWSALAIYFGRQWQTKSGMKIEGSVEQPQSQSQSEPPSQQ